jgi:ribonucleoside-diphosphate reductase alpha chain
MNTVVKIQPKDVGDISFQEASFDIWDKKYRLTAKDGSPIDNTMDDTYKRVARALADVESEECREQWYESFLWALRHGAIPAGRVTSNAGALEHKPIDDQLHGIRHHPRLDGRYLEQGARGGLDAESGLRNWV